MGRTVVADAGPLIAFARLDLLALLPEMLGTLLVPEVVLNECLYVLASCKHKIGHLIYDDNDER